MNARIYLKNGAVFNIENYSEMSEVHGFAVEVYDGDGVLRAAFPKDALLFLVNAEND